MSGYVNETKEILPLALKNMADINNVNLPSHASWFSSSVVMKLL
jgi:hypothetical protein